MLKRTDAITNKVLEPISFVLAYPTVYGICTRICQPSFKWDKNKPLYRNICSNSSWVEKRPSYEKIACRYI